MIADGPQITVTRAEQLLNCGRTKVWELIKAGRIRRAPQFGKEAVVLTEDVLRLAAGDALPATAKPKRSRAKTGDKLADSLLAVPLDGGRSAPN